LNLSANEINDLVAFLQTLTDSDGERRPLPKLLELPYESMADHGVQAAH
jgi:hypothetical protein